MSITQLIEKYRSNRSFYLTNGYNETQLRSDFLDPFFELLGWDIKNNNKKSTNEREVILEEVLKNTFENSKRPDYTFRLFAERKFFLEAKKPSIKIETDTQCAKQVRRYGFTAKLKISVISNFEYLIIYDTSVKVEEEDSYKKALIKKYHYSEYEKKFDEIKQFLGREAVYSGTFDLQWKDIENKIGQYSIDNIFLKQINNWRNALGTEICKFEPNIDEQSLNDIVQSYLNRILFLRVCEDRNIETYQTLLRFANTNDFNALIKKFKEADKLYNSGLFEQFLKDKIIENISSVFWTIIKQLYYPESPYSFSVFSSDILGQIYESFLSEKITISNNSIDIVKKAENIDRDIVSTPTFIINDILRNTVLPKCKDKTDQEILQLKFADIACGSGAFLLELFQLLNDILIDYYLKNDKSKLIQTNIDTYKLPFETKRSILLNCIFGIDKDFNAVEATKFGLLLKLLENENINSISGIKPILPNLSKNIFFGNSLLDPKQVKEEVFSKINPFDFSGLSFDIIVGNPPYMKSEDMKNITPLEFPIYKTYSSAYKQFDKYFLFIEQGLNLLKNDGILGYIIPNKFIKVGAGKKLRELLSKRKYLHSIISFGANQIFTDKTTYTCLLFLTKQPKETFQYIEIKDLNLWKTRQPNTIIPISKKISDLDDDIWVLVPTELSNIYDKIISQSIKLTDLVGVDNIFNGIQTSANDVYIFTPIKENEKYYFFKKDNTEYRIEKEITRPYFKTSSGKDNLYTYRTFKPNARVIYPYISSSTGVDIIPLRIIQKDFPLAYEYIEKHKTILNNPKRDIKPQPQTQNEWYRYGRHQSLSNCGLPQKIIVGVLSLGNKYAIDTYGTLISSGGTAGYCIIALPEDSPYSIYYLQAILNSKYLEWFCSLYGEVFRGGHIARGTKVLRNLPIRKINFSDKKEKEIHDKITESQRKLIKIFDKIDINIGNKRILTPLQKQFDKEKEYLDKLLTKLYNLGSSDSLIPLIKELHETN